MLGSTEMEFRTQDGNPNKSRPTRYEITIKSLIANEFTGLSFMEELDGFSHSTLPHVGGCQNYGPFLDPYCNTAPNK